MVEACKASKSLYLREERKGAKLKVEKRLLCEWKIQKIDVEVVTIKLKSRVE